MAHRYHPDPERDLVLDATTMKALAHPLRVRLVGLLRLHGPATATQLAQRAGVNSGATSYHLRQLADAGLVVEDPSRGTARDRWWAAAHRSTYFEGENLPAEEGIAYLSAVAEVYAAAMHRAIDEMPSLPKAWAAVGTLSDYGLRLTAAETRSLLEEICEVIGRYRPADAQEAPRGTRRVSVQLQAFVTPGVPATDGVA